MHDTNAGQRRSAIGLALLLVLLLFTPSAQAASDAEAWARGRICAGEPADFSLYPPARNGSDAARVLGASFLTHLSTGTDDACKVLPPHGIEIVGAWFREPIDLQGANIPVQLRLRESRFDAPVILDRARVDKLLSFAGSRFASPLMMTEIGVRGSLFLGEGAHFEDRLVLSGANIDGQASFSSEAIDTPDAAAPATRRRTRFDGPVDMSGARIGSILDLRGIEAAKAVVLDRARIDGNLRLSDGRFAGDLNMDSIKVGESVEAWGTVWGELRKDGACVATRDPAAAQWRFYNAEVRANVYLAGACLADLSVLNLTGTRIGGQLFLGSLDHHASRWGDRSIMILRNAAVGKIQDLPLEEDGSRPTPPGVAAAAPRESWPSRIELDGFTYGSWDGLGRQERPGGKPGEWVTIPARDQHWLIAWAARDHSYTRQPYDQLAKVMATQGRTDASNDILFASREIERCMTAAAPGSEGIAACVLQVSDLPPPSPDVATARVGEPEVIEDASASAAADSGERQLHYGLLTAIWLLNGYGYRPLWSIGWFAVLILIGTLLFRFRTGEGRTRTVWYALEYTLDTLLPAVTLCKDFDTIKIDGPIRYYFIALKVLGYVFVATLLQVFYQVVGRSIT